MVATGSSNEAGSPAPRSIFISYARGDVARVQQLAAGLERAGYDVWWDRQIGGGAEFAREIETALAAADVVLVAWSANSVDSHWVRDEAASGRDSGRLLPVSLDGTDPPLGFRQFQTIDLSRWNGRASAGQFQSVLQALAPGARARPRVPDSRARSWPMRRIAAAAGLTATIAAVAAGALYWPIGSRAAAAPELQIAQVQSISPNVEAHLVSQLRQELRTTLAMDNAITVLSEAAGATPGGRFAISATIDRSPDLIKVAVELGDTSSGISLWSKMLEIPADQIEQAPRLAAYKVGTVIRCALSSRSQKLEPRALALWTTWCDEMWSRGASIDRLLAAARNVTDAAPDFSDGWATRAQAAAPVPGDSAQGELDALRKEAEEAAERALRLDPENGQAYAAKALLRPDGDYAGKEVLLKKAISVRPTDCVCEQVMYAQFLLSLGRTREAHEHYRRAHEMRPVAPFGSVGQAQTLFLLGREDDARAVLAEAREIWPDDHGLKMMQLRGAIWTGRYDEAIALLSEPGFKVPQPRREPWLAALKALQSGSAADRAGAVRTLVEASRKPGANNMVVISTLGALGANAEAIDAARRFIGEFGRGWAMVLFEPTLAGARKTPEFARLVRELGMTRYWAQSNKAADFCSLASGAACSAA